MTDEATRAIFSEGKHIRLENREKPRKFLTLGEHIDEDDPDGVIDSLEPADNADWEETKWMEPY